MPKVCLAITANHDKIDRDFMMHLVTLQRSCNFVVSLKGEHIKSASLNEHVAEASNSGCSHIFFMDVDMNFPPWTLTRLMSHNLPIITGLYHLKSPPYSPIMGWSDKNGFAVNGRGRRWKDDYFPLPRNSLVEIHWCGIGCLLVDMDVFNKIYFPPFRDEWDIEVGKRHKGHDVIFCEAVRKAGYDIFADTSVDVMHIGRAMISRAWVETYHRVNMARELTNTVHDYSLEQPWWDERWSGMLYNKIETGYRELIRDFVNKIPKGGSVIDLGCGDGTALRFLRDANGCDVYGMDFSDTSMKILQEKGIPGEKVDLRAYSPNGRRAHTVILSHVLEHMIDNAAADKLVKLVSDMATDQAFIAVPDDKELWYEHSTKYDEDSLRAAVAPHFDSVEVYSIKRDKLASHTTDHHIVAHCHKAKAAGAEEVAAAITGVSEGGVPSTAS
jgi:trans-aconitate methyltransferase